MKRRTAMVVTAVAGVLAGILVFVGVVALTGSDSPKGRLGEERFDVGRARNIARTIGTHGPLLFQDLVGGSRDIYVQHAGRKWRAFSAHAPGAARRCLIRWRAASRDFVDRCSNEVYPANGDGLTQYSADVDSDGKLFIDLNQQVLPQ